MFILGSVTANCLLDAQRNWMKSRLQINFGNVAEVLFETNVTNQELEISMKMFYFVFFSLKTCFSILTIQKLSLINTEEY